MSRSTQSQIEDVLSELWRREQAYEKAVLEYAEAHYEFKLKYAVEYRKANGTIDDRKNTALEMCAKEFKRDLQTEAVMAFTKESLKDSQMSLSARQSLLKADRETEFGQMNTRHSA